MGSVLELFGHIFAVKNEAAAPKMPQERPKAPTPKSPQLFGFLLEGHFQDFCDHFFDVFSGSVFKRIVSHFGVVF